MSLWLLFLQVTVFCFSITLHGGNETDKLSLISFRAQIIGDPFGAMNSWNESVHFCEWSGVTCGRRHQRVVELDLHCYRLVGSLSPSIGNLSFLRVLNLENNSFGHNIPQELGQLFRLQMLRLGINSFSGEIPVNISRCSNLLNLDLERNNLTGKLPALLGSLSKLQVLIFRRNNLVGETPPSFGNLSSIKEIRGAFNNLQGSIPNTIGQLKRLKIFSFGVNNLSGTIPPSIFNLSSLINFGVPVNQLHGSLPPDLGITLPNLEVLLLHTNLFRGVIPVTLSNASSLSNIQISSNFFTGLVPTLVGSLPNLRFLSIYYNVLGNGEDDNLNFLYPLANNTILEILLIHNNNFGGALPEILGNFSTKLKSMIFGGNQIRGTIPNGIGNLRSLVALSFEANQLTGIIPSSIGKLQNVGILYLNTNKISGSIPSSMGNMTACVDVDLSLNNLQGSIPSSFGNCQNLLALTLSHNNLSGPIPKEITSITSLSLYLNLSANQLTGSLPFEIGKLENLGKLDVSKNRLSGEIPLGLGSCTSLEFLDLGENVFEGFIPKSLSSLRALDALDLSHNNLSGQIPKFLGNFKLLKSLNLSFNDFEGEVPMQGAFGNASVVSITGNRKLCGGIPLLNLPRCTTNESGKMKSSTKKILIIAMSGGFLGAILLTSSVLCYCLRKTKGNPASTSSWGISFRRVTYQDLLRATNEFFSVNLIGVGSFGSVYKGILPPDGMAVAVKVLNLLRRGASKSFLAECTALINIRHRNLVRVITACSSIDFQGNDFKAVVYELMPNASLEEWLHSTHHQPNNTHEPRSLNLTQRLDISIDVANALDYLHHHCHTPIVHCDLKPSNVLLDGDMTASVGDFGLARLQPEVPGQLSSDQTSSIGLKGTIGYAAPGKMTRVSLLLTVSIF